MNIEGYRYLKLLINDYFKFIRAEYYTLQVINTDMENKLYRLIRELELLSEINELLDSSIESLSDIPEPVIEEYPFIMDTNLDSLFYLSSNQHDLLNRSAIINQIHERLCNSKQSDHILHDDNTIKSKLPKHRFKRTGQGQVKKELSFADSIRPG